MKSRKRAPSDAPLRRSLKYNQVNYDDLNINTKWGARRARGRINQAKRVKSALKTARRLGLVLPASLVGAMHWKQVEGLKDSLGRIRKNPHREYFTQKDVKNLRRRSQRDAFLADLIEKRAKQGKQTTKKQALQAWIDKQSKATRGVIAIEMQNADDWIAKAEELGMSELVVALRKFGTLLTKELVRAGFNLMEVDYDSGKGTMNTRIGDYGYSPSVVINDFKHKLEESGSGNAEYWDILRSKSLGDYYMMHYPILQVIEEVTNKYEERT